MFSLLGGNQVKLTRKPAEAAEVIPAQVTQSHFLRLLSPLGVLKQQKIRH